MFYIKESEGVNFAKLSGDNNLIHIDKIAGHNSIHGHNIVHGVLLILKFFKKIKFKQNYSSIKVQFQKGLKGSSLLIIPHLLVLLLLIIHKLLFRYLLKMVTGEVDGQLQ